MSYLTDHNYTDRDVTERLDDRQVKNSDGGYVYQIDMWARARRFLVLGTEGGTYYASEFDITKENVRNLEGCIKQNGEGFVAMLYNMRDRVPKRQTIFYALALAVTLGDQKTKEKARYNFHHIVRTGSDLLQFVEFVDKMRGWGRSLQKMVSGWYEHHQLRGSLTYQVLKYQNRNGWSHKDVLRMCHYGCHGQLPDVNNSTLRWVVGRDLGVNRIDDDAKGLRGRNYPATDEMHPMIKAYEEMKRIDSVHRASAIIAQHGFTHEMVMNKFKNSVETWAALFPRMPMTAMIRNLGKMTQVGLLSPFSPNNDPVVEKLNRENVIKSKVHPIQMLMAYTTYKSGRGIRGNLEWNPVEPIVDALEEGFYSSFGNVESTDKNTLIAIDVSPSMEGNPIVGCPGLDARMGAACLAMATARTEAKYHIVAFAGRIETLGLTAKDSIQQAMNRTRGLSWNYTDCSKPFEYAIQNKLNVDTFIVITDNETNSGSHPKYVMNQYRKKFNPDAKLIVIGMTATDFSIADPEDKGMLDIVGFDSAAPNLIKQFVLGELG